MDKNSSGGVKVSVTLYFFLKTEMTNFQRKQKEKRMLYPHSNKGLILILFTKALLILLP